MRNSLASILVRRMLQAKANLTWLVFSWRSRGNRTGRSNCRDGEPGGKIQESLENAAEVSGPCPEGSDGNECCEQSARKGRQFSAGVSGAAGRVYTGGFVG